MGREYSDISGTKHRNMSQHAELLTGDEFFFKSKNKKRSKRKSHKLFSRYSKIPEDETISFGTDEEEMKSQSSPAQANGVPIVHTIDEEELTEPLSPILAQENENTERTVSKKMDSPSAKHRRNLNLDLENMDPADDESPRPVYKSLSHVDGPTASELSFRSLRNLFRSSPKKKASVPSSPIRGPVESRAAQDFAPEERGEDSQSGISLQASVGTTQSSLVHREQKPQDSKERQFETATIRKEGVPIISWNRELKSTDASTSKSVQSGAKELPSTNDQPRTAMKEAPIGGSYLSLDDASPIEVSKEGESTEHVQQNETTDYRQPVTLPPIALSFDHLTEGKPEALKRDENPGAEKKGIIAGGDLGYEHAELNGTTSSSLVQNDVPAPSIRIKAELHEAQKSAADIAASQSPKDVIDDDQTGLPEFRGAAPWSRKGNDKIRIPVHSSADLSNSFSESFAVHGMSDSDHGTRKPRKTGGSVLSNQSVQSTPSTGSTRSRRMKLGASNFLKFFRRKRNSGNAESK